MADPPPIFEQYPVASWTVRGDSIYFPTESIEEDGGNRIVRRARPYRDGAKLDDTGSKEKEFTITGCFDNSIEEPDMLNTPGELLYPDTLNRLIESFDLHETGTLVTSTRGAVRCRLLSYKRVENFDSRDSATVTLTFVMDNEDSVDAQSFQNPSVRATIHQAIQETTFSMESKGGFSQMLADLEQFATDLTDAIAAPGEAIQDVDQKAARVARIALNVEKQMSVTGELGRDLLTDPDSWATLRNLHILRDRTARAAEEKNATGVRIITAVFAQDKSIYDIATQLQQNADDLIGINTQLENLLLIAAGTVVKVFERPTG